MKFFANLKLGSKFLLSFSIILVLVGTLGFVTLRGGAATSTSIQRLDEESLHSLENQAELVAAVSQIPEHIYQVGLTKGPDAEDAIKEADEHFAEAEAAVANLLKVSAEGSTKEAAVKVADAIAEFKSKWQSNKNALRASSGEEVQAIYEREFGPVLDDKLHPALADLAHLNEEAANGKVAATQGTVATLTKTAWIVLSSTLFVLVLVGWVLTRSIVGPITQLKARLTSLEGVCVTGLNQGIRAMAEGDLTHTVTPVTKPMDLDTNDEIGQMSKMFNQLLGKMVDTIQVYHATCQQLSTLVRGVRQSSETVAHSSEAVASAAAESGRAATEIAEGSERLAMTAADAARVTDLMAKSIGDVNSGSQQQQAMVEEAQEQINRATEEIQTAGAAAETVSVLSSEGSQAVSAAIEAMDRLQERVAESVQQMSQLEIRSKQIGSIVQTINSIAEQTNLLALNAAIEAARAGEHGRGFAVVADEVRKLAEQSKASSVQIADLVQLVAQDSLAAVDSIRATQSEVEAGVSRSNEAGEALQKIDDAVKNVVDAVTWLQTGAKAIGEAMTKVSVAAESNAGRASEVNQGAEEVNSTIESVAAVAEESSASSEELSATVEEIAASAHELSRLSEDLLDQVSRFKTLDETPVNLRIAA